MPPGPIPSPAPPKKKGIRFHTPPHHPCAVALSRKAEQIRAAEGRARKGGSIRGTVGGEASARTPGALESGAALPCRREALRSGGPERRDLGRSPARGLDRPRQWRRRAACSRYWHCCCCCSARRRSCSPTRKVRAPVPCLLPPVPFLAVTGLVCCPKRTPVSYCFLHPIDSLCYARTARLARTNTGVLCSDWAALMLPRFLLTSGQLKSCFD
jgi:hypothetical protein